MLVLKEATTTITHTKKKQPKTDNNIEKSAPTVSQTIG